MRCNLTHCEQDQLYLLTPSLLPAAGLGFQSLFGIANGTSLASPYAVAVAAHVLLETEGMRGQLLQTSCCFTVYLIEVFHLEF